MDVTSLERVKLILGITDSTQDSYIDIMASGCFAEYDEIRGSGYPLDDDGEDIYPETREFVVADMIGFRKNSKSSQGLTSERLADYGWTREASTGGYPQSILGRIKRYVRFK